MRFGWKLLDARSGCWTWESDLDASYFVGRRICNCRNLLFSSSRCLSTERGVIFLCLV